MSRVGVARAAFLTAVSLWGYGCIVGGNKCDENQVHVDEGSPDYCTCAPGTIMGPDGYGCVRCGKNEEVDDGRCVCRPGFSRTSPTAACEKTEGQAIGAACEDSAGCRDPYPHCATDGSERYCTRTGCGDEACPDGYTCETVGDSEFCAKLPTGIGEQCSSNDQCADFDASECDTFNRRCVLGGCAVGRSSCPNTWQCCDISMFAPGVSFCSMPGEMCVGKVVTP
jgi:hypothetical protein